ncbi:MarR family transcriptional regulator [Amnibacterium soli]|uniref:MarR family transcriptional regulator n=1 Tax=Amnibacterium soli TaxID=1282736 RepID=A0ABP8YML5_9MICO
MEVGTRSDDEVLGRAIKQVQWRHHRTLDARMRAIGSTIVQWDVLRALETQPDASAHDLAQATFQSDQSLGVMMRGMEAKGLVERRAGKGRRLEHRITEAGARVLEQGHGFAAEVLATSFAALDDEARAQLLGLLRRIGAGA